MYCIYCGTQINEGVECKACAEKRAPVSPFVEPQIQPAVEPVAQPYYAQSTQPVSTANPRKLGFKKALAATIISFVGLIFVICLYCMGLVGIMDEDSFYFSVGFSFIFLLAPSIIGTILPLVQGIQSIITFRRAQGPKPIATLVLGINTVYIAAMSVFFLFLSFIFFLAGVGIYG